MLQEPRLLGVKFATQTGKEIAYGSLRHARFQPHSNSRSPASNNNNSSTSEWFLPPNEQPAMNSTSTGTHSGMANNNNNNNSINGSVVPSTISGGTNATRTRRKNERPSIITLFKSVSF